MNIEMHISKAITLWSSAVFVFFILYTLLWILPFQQSKDIKKRLYVF